MTKLWTGRNFSGSWMISTEDKKIFKGEFISYKMKRGSMKIQNKRGLSAVVATLIIILLTLVAVGIIWIVIRNVVESGAGQIDLSQKCISVDLTALSVVESPAGTYAITLKRGSDSQGDMGVKVNLFAGATSSGVFDWGVLSDLDALGTVTKTVGPTGLNSATKVEFTAFFEDDSGNQLLCLQTREFNF